jgi:DNA-binding response OmpR family regulator
MGTILVIDRERDPAETLAELLRTAGHEVDVVSDTASAYAYVRRGLPDLVVIDLMEGPGEEGGTEPEGLKLLAQLYLDHPEVPLLVWTRAGGYRDQFWSWAAAAHLDKQEGSEPVLTVVADLLGTKAGGPTPND